MILHIILTLLSVGALFFVLIRLYLMDSKNNLYRIIMYCAALTLILAYCEHEFITAESANHLDFFGKLFSIIMINISLTPMLGWYYAEMEKIPRFEKWINPIFYGNLAIGVIFLFIQVFTSYQFLYFAPSMFYGYGANYNYSPVFFAWLSWVLIIITLTTVGFYRAYRTAKEGKDKYWKRINVFINAVVISACYILNALLPSLGYTIPTFLVPIMTLILVVFAWSFTDFKLFEVSSNNAIQNIVGTMSNMMILTDKELKIKEVNTAAIELLNLNDSEVNEKKLHQVINLNELEIYEIIQTLENDPTQRISKEIDVIISDKKVNHLLFTASAIINQKGVSTGYVFIGTDLTAYKNTQAKLEESNEELLISNKELEQFAYVASHDLQEPLRMVGNFVQLLEFEYKDKIDEEGKTYINYAVNGVSRMSSLINDLLNFSRLGKQVVHKKWFSLERLMNHLILDLSASIADKNADIVTEKLPQNIFGDQNLMKMIFQNLVTNGLKFNKSKKPIIHISAKTERNNWVFAIKDNGIGIAENNRNKIFEIFKRLHRKEVFKGTGIGLSICRKAVNLQGGEIWFESEMGKGTTFFFTIPKS